MNFEKKTASILEKFLGKILLDFIFRKLGKFEYNFRNMLIFEEVFWRYV